MYLLNMLPTVEKGLISVKISLLLPLQVLDTPVEKDNVSQCETPEHLLFGLMPLKKSNTKLG